jgi:hypothetical protein
MEREGKNTCNDSEFFGLSTNNQRATADSSTPNASGGEHLHTQTSQMGNDNTPDIVKRIVKEDIRGVYKMGKMLGSGNFGTVRLATPH